MFWIYLHKTITIVFTPPFDIKWTKFDRSSTITTEVTLFGYVIYSSADVHCKSIEEYIT